MEQEELERLRQQFDGEVRNRFPGAPIQQVEVLQYGDEPSIEPGQLLGRVILDAPAGAAEGGKKDSDDLRGRALEEFHAAHRDAVRELRRELDRLPVNVVLEVMVGGERAEGQHGGPRLKLTHGPRGLGGGGGGGEGAFTPVMARLGVEDLETLDTLITAGIAPSRAEAVRWALARIRERPAYEQLRARAREIEELKAQF
jgi:hypothetical protein